MKIEVLIGMITSGKSTYARERADQGAIVIQHDDLTEMLHQRYRYEQEKRAMYRMMEMKLATTALSFGCDVVIDRTHLTRESRERWVCMARMWNIESVAVLFPRFSAEKHAIRRFNADSRGRPLAEWLRAADHHAQQEAAEPINHTRLLAEGFNTITIRPRWDGE
jgi:predicted kinase